MGTSAIFDGIVHAALNAHAAWFPITNTFRVGDYGLVNNGVLWKLGNIKDFGVAFSAAPGQNVDLNFTSKGTRITRISGGVDVDAFAGGNADAKIAIEFANESAFFIRAKLSYSEIQNVNAVAHGLVKALDQGWRRKFRVVYGLYTARNCTIISSAAVNSKIEITGKANALKELEIGNAEADVARTSSQDIGFELIGRTGPVAIATFKLPWLFGDTPKTLSDNEAVSIERDEKRQHLDDDI